MLDLPIGSEFAGYRIEGVAGRGGMGVVYKATEVVLDRPVALKLISGELADDEVFRERFRREARLAASIRHPNVITVFRAGEEGGALYIAMDYVEGTDLKAIVAERRKLEPHLAAELVSQVAAALDAAHARTLVHRDVKPANVLVTTDGGDHHAFLTDFGLTKNVQSQTAMTETGLVVGTVDYMAPEQIEGQGVDARADVYSLGCVLYEVLTGRVPYPRESNMAKMYAHAQEPPPSIAEVAPEVPVGFGNVIERAMAKHPTERYPSAGDLGRAAVAAAEGTEVEQPERSVAAGEAAAGAGAATVHVPEVLTVETAGRVPGDGRPRRRRLLIAGLAVLLLGIVAAVALVGGGNGGDDAPKELSKDRYQDEVLDASRPFTAGVLRLDTRLPAHVTDPNDAIRAGSELAAVRETADTSIAELRRLRPPSDIDDLHARILEEFARMRSIVADAGAAADAGDDRVYREAPGKLQRSFDALDTLGPEFKARGYRRLGFGSSSG